jgi:hypothetical protein
MISNKVDVVASAALPAPKSYGLYTPYNSCWRIAGPGKVLIIGTDKHVRVLFFFISRA